MKEIKFYEYKWNFKQRTTWRKRTNNEKHQLQDLYVENVAKYIKILM